MSKREPRIELPDQRSQALIGSHLLFDLRDVVTYRRVGEVLHLKFDCRLTKRQIAKSCAIARSTVAEYVRRFACYLAVIDQQQSIFSVCRAWWTAVAAAAYRSIRSNN